ncbi:DNA-directed DNA polymerase [Senna tora]|uniref:DNA-directed DNA polymerase n=1 Tax=Senna tora TaxID=362788 RepID=A0A835CES9_9FABA|nr:DNA-directed DNA polymerase [Senna tora]
MVEEKTLREHSPSPVNQAPLCIATPTLQAPLELKSGMIHLLPKFRGLMNEDPYQHLKEFHVVCSSMKPDRVTEQKIKLRAFPFSLDGAIKEWLFYLPVGSITTWEEITRLFLHKYFPSSRVINVRRDICGIKQKVTKTLFDYWEHFKKLYSSCPQLDIPEQSLLHYFYEGLLPTERTTSESLGKVKNFKDKPQPPPSQQPSSSRSDSSLEDIVIFLALNTQQFQMSTQQFQNETRSSIQSLESQVSKLTTSMSKMESHGKLPSQTEVNPRQNVSAITLRSGKELEELPKTDPELKLNQLPKHFKHAFLEAQVEEQRIVLEENYKSIQEAQNHINPPMMEVFKKEFQKLLDTDMNYPVLDSKISGKVQWVPKKTGVAVMKSSELGDNIVPKPLD